MASLKHPGQEIKRPTKWCQGSRAFTLNNDGKEAHLAGLSTSHPSWHYMIADNPIPYASGNYYYEAKIHHGHGGTGAERLPVIIGYATRDCPIQTEWLFDKHENVWAYLGSEGRTLPGRNEYGPSFGSGDVIGCGINRAVQSRFFTKNNEALGALYHNLGSDTDIYPCIAIREDAGPLSVTANFGDMPFTFSGLQEHELSLNTIKRQAAVLPMEMLNNMLGLFLDHMMYRPQGRTGFRSLDRKEKHALSALSLTCKKWGELCRPLIFRTISLRQRKCLLQFKELIDSSPDPIATWVHVLNLGKEFMASDWVHLVYVALAHDLQDLGELAYNSKGVYPNTASPPRITRAYSSLCSPLHSLEVLALASCNFPNFTDIMRLCGALESLRTLEMRRVTWTRSPEKPPTMNSTGKLRSVLEAPSLTGPNRTDMRGVWLLLAPARSMLTSRPSLIKAELCAVHDILDLQARNNPPGVRYTIDQKKENEDWLLVAEDYNVGDKHTNADRVCCFTTSFRLSCCSKAICGEQCPVLSAGFPVHVTEVTFNVTTLRPVAYGVKKRRWPNSPRDSEVSIWEHLDRYLDTHRLPHLRVVNVSHLCFIFPDIEQHLLQDTQGDFAQYMPQTYKKGFLNFEVQVLDRHPKAIVMEEYGRMRDELFDLWLAEAKAAEETRGSWMTKLLGSTSFWPSSSRGK